MKVVHLSYYYGTNTSGAPMAAMRLHRALLRMGVDSHFVCVDQREHGENVHRLPRGWVLATIYYVVPRVFWVLSKLLFGRMYMPNLIPLVGFGRLMRQIKPDVVHVHFIGQDMLSFRQIENVHCPTVITLHDLSLVNAVDAYPGSDRRFAEGFTKSNSSAVERWMFGRKKAFLSAVKSVFTGPSSWVCGMFSQSLIGNRRAAEAIPNIIDPVFRLDETRRIRTGKFTLLFGAYGGRASSLKGWIDLETALGLLPADVKANLTVNVFGEGAADCEANGVRLHFLGAIRDSAMMRDAYHKADVFAFPSRQETQGMVKAEALLCGLPVLVFDRTACAESIRHMENGWVSPSGDIADYAKGIEFFYRMWRRGELDLIRGKIAETARDEFSEVEIVRKMMDVYACVCQCPVAETATVRSSS